MPTYQYACKDCANSFEIFQSFSDASLTECPQCNGNLRKVFNSVGVVFKGSGFYRTDSRNESNGKATIPSRTKESSDNVSSSSSSSDSSTSDSSNSSKSSSDSSTTKRSESTKSSTKAPAAASA